MRTNAVANKTFGIAVRTCIPVYATSCSFTGTILSSDLVFSIFFSERISSRFERLPNVVPMAYEEEDFPSLIRRIAQEEIQKVIAQPRPTTDSLEDLIR
ncbi:hypothetical protein LAZ67_12001743 [Cordylochernes scorpioides]|uniref:Uncharacterized protein n=1 Tax=Cordylochernes scorpioides TaxID=51811 RepID=A0ABY6L1R2_9ARAC|nr:hypothetical protein LAZ67_12001743 [Cordylochernes scorpioides]